MFTRWITSLLCCGLAATGFAAQDNRLPFQAMDVFELELASEARVSPDGERIVYVRQRMDVMTDRPSGDLWIINTDGSGHEPLVTGEASISSPRFSPDGKRLLYASNGALYVRYLDSGRETAVTRTRKPPRNPNWSPDGKWIAFNMDVPAKAESFAQLPTPPEGAEWAEPPKFIDELLYRADGAGYLEENYTHLFVVPAEGGTPRQLTSGDYNHGAPAWSHDGSTLYFSANRKEDWRYDPLESEIHAIDIDTQEISTLTDRDGPDSQPAVSPDGRHVAYVGFDDERLGYHVSTLYLLDLVDGTTRSLTDELDRSVQSPVWDEKGRGLYFLYDSEGQTRLGYVRRNGEVRKLADSLGGLSYGRPYTRGDAREWRHGRLHARQPVSPRRPGGT